MVCQYLSTGQGIDINIHLTSPDKLVTSKPIVHHQLPQLKINNILMGNAVPRKAENIPPARNQEDRIYCKW
ncbi:unnamed protein product [Schistosoma intercalatum]|nr:unnamed protein product [Schistosoma intercalatum]